MENEYRRSIPIGDKEKVEKFEALMKEKNFSTEDATVILQVVKLKGCEGVSVIQLGLYQGYVLKGKYGNPDITDGTVILIKKVGEA